MTKPFKRNLTIYRGATFRDAVVWKTGATTATATPVDLTGYTARAQIRADIDSTTVLHEMTTENGGIVLNTVPGQIALYISAVATEAFDWESAVYDLELIAPNGDVLRRMAGNVTTSKEVTR